MTGVGRGRGEVVEQLQGGISFRKKKLTWYGILLPWIGEKANSVMVYRSEQEELLLKASLFSLIDRSLAGVTSKDPVYSVIFAFLVLSTVMALSTLFLAMIC